MGDKSDEGAITKKEVLNLFDALFDRIKDLHDSDKRNLDLIKLLNTKVDKRLGEVKESLDTLYEGMALIGGRRIVDCEYSRGGYCEHSAYAMPRRPKDGGDTAKIRNRYYPAVTWVICYSCTKYEVPPEQIASK